MPDESQRASGDPFELGYWAADARLDGLVSGYHRYAINAPPGERHADVFFPSWAIMRFHAGDSAWRVRLGNTVLNVPPAALFGPSSRVGFSDSSSGITVGAGLTPRGWYRLTRATAADFADRIDPLEALLPGRVDARIANLPDARPDEIKPALDAFLLPLLDTPRPDEARVEAMHAYLMEPLRGGVGDMAERLGMSHRTLNRLSLAAFGFSPKMLVRRARFLRSLTALMDDKGETWASQIQGSYYDHSHFNRDAQEFLGMSPGEFLRLPRPMNRASALLRTRILGAPAQALIEPRLTRALDA